MRLSEIPSLYVYPSPPILNNKDILWFSSYLVYFVVYFPGRKRLFGWRWWRGAGLCGPNKSRWRLSGSQQQVFHSSDGKQQLRSLHNTAGLLEKALSPAWRCRCFVQTLPNKPVYSKINRTWITVLSVLWTWRIKNGKWLHHPRLQRDFARFHVEVLNY